MTRRWAGLLLAALLVPAQAAEVRSLEVEHRGDLYRVAAALRIAVAADRAHGLLTDYPNLHRLTPAIEVSEVVAELGEGHRRVRVLTRGCVLFFCRAAVNVQDVRLLAGREIRAVTVPEDSDFAYGTAHWQVREEADGSLLLFDTELRPKFWVPPGIGPWAIKRKLAQAALDTAEGLERLALDTGPTQP